MNLEQIEALKRRFQNIKTEYTKWKPAHKELKLINPARGIFDNDRTKIGIMFNHKELLSAYGTHALRVFASGLNSGMTNKSTKWFKLTVRDQSLLESPGVREWLDDVEDILYDILNQSNIYEVFYSTYEELGQFGTGCYLILEDLDDVIRGRSLTTGEYYLSVDAKGRPIRFAREYEMTIEQIVHEFGLESCSDQVKADWQSKSNYNKTVRICHMIEPNDSRDTSKIDNKNMKYRSIYWEDGKAQEGFLRISGHKMFRVIAPRWDTITTDTVYGYGPGWYALGSIKEMQATRLDKLMNQAKIHNPPTIQDASVPGYVNLLPGGSTKSSSNLPNTGVRAAYQVPDALESFIQLLDEEREEIDKFFFVNLFLMISNLDDRQRTAEEIATRQQEKLMMMGSALHRLDTEMLSPTLENVYDIAQDMGAIPEPPINLDINIEFTGILAQAQKAIGIGKIDALITRAGTLAQLGHPEAFDNIDLDEAMRESAQMDGAPAKIIADKQMMDKVREQRQKQQNQALALQGAESASNTAKNLGQTPVGQGSALDSVAAAAR